MKQMLKIFKIALQSINKNRTRSLLTMLGIIIGVGSVIMTISAGEGASIQINDQISSLGTNLLMIYPKKERRAAIEVRMGKKLDKKDYAMLEKNSVWITKLSPLVAIGAQVVGPEGHRSSTIYGASSDYFDIVARELNIGDFFSEEDVKNAKKVCVIGETIREELFPNTDPIGQQLRIDKVPFEIVGLLKEEGENTTGEDQDDMVIAPYTTVQNRLTGHQQGYTIIMGSAMDEDHIMDAKIEATELLLESHKITDGEQDFEVTTQIELQAITGNIVGILTILLGAVASISLVVGGIGIMNIMLVSVTERTREIGTRLAIGAREKDILTQFLIEAIVLSLVGGTLGILLGAFGNQLIYMLTDFYMPTVVYSIFIGFGFSAIVGIAFGYFPARKAARLNPIDALRYE